jgi:hypothetical protein
MTNREIIRAARAEQGGDAFPGIDKYKVKTLPPGTRLVKLEPSSSGYFIPWKEYIRMKRDSGNLSSAYQLAPWDTRNKTSIPYDYIYRKEASLFLTTKEIKVASGFTNQNTHYGKGGAVQIHICNYKKGFDQHNLSIGIHNKASLQLVNFGIETKTGDAIEYARKIHTQTRNYHAYLSQAEELKRLRDQLKSPGQIRICNDRLNELSNHINHYKNEIVNNRQKFHSLYPTLPQPTAPTYEKAIRYQERLAAALDKTQEIDPKMEKESRDLREHLTAKVEMTAGKVIRGEWKPGECDREVKIDEVRKLYESDQFVKRALCQKQLADNSARISQLERALIQFDRHDSDLADRGRLGHTIQEPPPGLAGELNALREQGQTLRGELRGLETRQADYHQFLTLCNKGPELSGPGLRFSS